MYIMSARNQISNLIKTFFQEETLNEIRIVENNILQCNLKVTVNSKPYTNACDNIKKLLSTATE